MNFLNSRPNKFEKYIARLKKRLLKSSLIKMLCTRQMYGNLKNNSQTKVKIKKRKIKLWLQVHNRQDFHLISKLSILKSCHHRVVGLSY